MESTNQGQEQEELNKAKIKEFNNQIDETINLIYGDEYIPSNLVSKASFLAKKKEELVQASMESTDRAFDGLMLLSQMNTVSPRLNDLLPAFFSAANLGSSAGKSVDEIREIVSNDHLFGLDETDFDEILSIADQMAEPKSDDSMTEQEHYKSAIDLYKLITVVFPSHIEGWLRWGNLVYQHYNVLEAYNIFAECNRMFDDPSVHFCLGLCKIKLKEYPEAKERLEIAMAKCDQYDEQALKLQIQDIMTDLQEVVA